LLSILSHNRANLAPTFLVVRAVPLCFQGLSDPNMPSLFRFLMTFGSLAAIVFATLYILASQFEPEPREVVKVVPGVKIKKPAN
jgi:hypothetical protein